jgi:hypothetical protein
VTAAFDWNPSERTLRQFAAAGFLFLQIVIAVSYWRGSHSSARWVVLALALVIGFTGLLRPSALRLPYVLLSMATYPIGLVVSQLMLGILFYGVITPLGVLARLARPDPLETRLDGRSDSHWKERSRPRDKASYLRQA